MKRKKAKQSGSGGRLRLGLLMACAAAFLLVPAANAAAVGPTVHVEIKGNGSGELTSEGGFQEGPGNFNHVGEGIPTIHCSGSEPGAGACNTTMTPLFPGFWVFALHPIAAPGSEFAGWEMTGAENNGGCAESENWESEGAVQCSIYSENSAGAATIVGKFVTAGDLTVEIDGTGSGTVNQPATGLLLANPPIACNYASPGPETGNCVGQMATFATLIGATVKAVVAPGSEFAGWEIIEGNNLEPTNPSNCVQPIRCAVGYEGEGNLGKDARLKATFNLIPPKYKLTVTKSGTGTGTVTSSPAGINCGVDCDEEYNEGTLVTLSKAASPGSEFKEWTGACSGSGTCEVTMSVAKSVNAKFDLIPRTLTITKTGAGGPTSFVECKFGAGSFGACTSPQPNGTLVEVKATAGATYVLKTITGTGSATSCTILNNPCSFTITEDSSVTAEFVSANTTDSKSSFVHGNVVEATELGTNGKCADVDLGTFAPLAAPATYPNNECVLTVTATGEVNTLTAADPSATDKGRLTQKPTHNYSLVEPLNVDATSTIIPSLGGAGGGLEPLSSDVTLMTYNKPVSKDNVIVEFSQLIKAYESLHTGVYSKTITLTLNQTTP